MNSNKKHSSGRKRLIKVGLIILVLCIIIRLLLPSIILHYANKSLAGMKGYYGHIEDIDVALIRGAYKIDSIYLNKLDSNTQKQTPFFSASLVDLSIEWKALLHGSVVGEMVFESPTLRFSKDKVEPKHLQKDSSKFKNLEDDFMPLQINRLEIKNGRIEYIDEFSKPKVDISLTNADLLAKNLKNSYDSAALLPASLTAKANVYEGTLSLNMKLNPLAKEPTFDVNAELKNVNLVKLNDFFKAYAKVDVNKGKFGLYAEAAAKDGKFDGYVKPLIKDLDILGHEDRADNIFQKLWEGIAGTVGQVFKNHPKDQVATKIPLKGSIKNPDSNIWYVLSEILQNAFISAIQPSIDNEISIASVDTKKDEKKTFLQKVFGKKDKKDDKQQDKKENKKK
jgi:hypothetical protein